MDQRTEDRIIERARALYRVEHREGVSSVNDKVTEIEGGYVVRLTETEFSLIIQALWTHWNENQSSETGREADALSDRLTD